jgi:hypothetical protein
MDSSLLPCLRYNKLSHEVSIVLSKETTSPMLVTGRLLETRHACRTSHIIQFRVIHVGSFTAQILDTRAGAINDATRYAAVLPTTIHSDLLHSKNVLPKDESDYASELITSK